MSDSRSNAIASRLMTSAMSDVAQRILAGESGRSARDTVLREVSGAWVQIAGKPIADQAVRGMVALEPVEYLTAAERRGLAMFDQMQAEKHARAQDAWQAEHDAILARCAPHLLPERSRPLVRLLQAAIALAVVAGGVLMFAGPSGARELDAGQKRWKALAACGVTSMSSPEYERRCRRFSRTERSVTRDYDGPGAGAPKSWEQPKDWE